MPRRHRGMSPAEMLAALPFDAREREIAALPPQLRARLVWDWRFWARPEQLAPAGDWNVWMICTGRGWGKTRTGAEWVVEERRKGRAGRIALVAETAADARDVLVEGPSGILAVSPPAERPLYEPSKRRLTWSDGAIATTYNGTEPDQLRGPQHDAAWVDELAKYERPQETWDMLQFGLRAGTHPRVVVTTTPRPIAIIKALLADPRTAVVRGATTDNRANLPEEFLSAIEARYGGTRLGRQEIAGELVDDIPGALWTREMFRRREPAPECSRIVVAVDPSGTTGRDGGDSIGIVVAGKCADGSFHVIEDATCRLGPAGWARRVVERFRHHAADRVIAERNFGGDMVRATLMTADPTLPVTMVTASRGKALRAEPVAALYEQGRITHTRGMDSLEEQMLSMTATGFVGEGSPDRVDALVWAITALSETHEPGAWLLA